MKQKMNMHFFIKIFTFILSFWIYHFKDDADTINKLLDENYIIDNKFCTKYYRLLAKCKTERDSSISQLKDIPRNEINEKNYISYSAKHSKSKNKPSNESSPRGKEGYKQDIKNNSCIFEKKKCSYFEKKIFKEIDFIDFLKNNRTISNNTYKKVIRKKYGLRIATPVLFFLLLLILMIIDISLGLSFEKSLLISLVNLNPFSVKESQWFLSLFEKVKSLDWLWKSPLWPTIETLTYADKKNVLLGRLIGVPLYFLPFVILGVTLIIALIYYHKKVKKYENIKFKRR
ncbi:fam-l protein [Plasmodium malariae]|uniref:Fam-l protein n=1 Tax=Plasmodium malariae TaxID=5858 RepID=A0A1D3JHN5_PLAMA|nr:fam-l protein [Plasmodium malariae]SBT85845.1 fam-l protein [Plasmodium malariae]